MDITLTPKQTRFYESVFNENGFIRTDNVFNEFASFGGFGSAKSFIVMLATLNICLRYPRTHWLYARASYPQLEDSVIRQFRELFPGDDFQYIYRSQKREIHFKNGSLIMFRAFDVDTKILSNQYHGASLCQAEEVIHAFYLQLWGRLRLHSNGIPKNIMLLEGNPGQGWCKERYIDNPLPTNVFFMQSTSYDNPYLPAGYIEKMKEAYPDAWFRRYVLGNWENLDEMVFNEFVDSIHVIDPIEIPDSFEKAAGMDYGYKNPSAIVFGAVDYDGDVIIYDEFYEAQKTPDELAQAANRHGRQLVVIDPSTKTPDRDGKDVFQELAIRGIRLRVANKHKLRNISTTNMLLKQKRLFVSRACVNLIKEIKSYKWQRMKLGEEEIKDHKEEVVKKDDHAVDALMYLLAYLVDMQSIEPTPIKPEHTLRFHTMFETEDQLLRKLG